MNDEIRDALWRVAKLMIEECDAEELAVIKRNVLHDYDAIKESLAACENVLACIEQREAELAEKPKKKGKSKKPLHSLLRS